MKSSAENEEELSKYLKFDWSVHFLKRFFKMERILPGRHRRIGRLKESNILEPICLIRLFLVMSGYSVVGIEKAHRCIDSELGLDKFLKISVY